MEGMLVALKYKIGLVRLACRRDAAKGFPDDYEFEGIVHGLEIALDIIKDWEVQLKREGLA